MVCAKMRDEVNLSGAWAIVMVVGLWQDGILQLSMGKGEPVYHVMPMPMPAGLYLASAFLNYQLV